MVTREIKFRAWCEDFGEFKMCHYNLNTCDNGIWFDMIEDFHSTETHSIMQFTGLKDKNGVEIYDGDIAKTRTGHLCTIIFDLVCEKTADGIYEYTGFCLHHIKQNQNYHLDNDPIEVIGNIYENPELLTNGN